MTAKDSQHVANFKQSLEDWTDERMVSRQDVEDLAMFSMYLVNLAQEDGWEYQGHSFSLALPMSRLVVRGTIDGTPHVVFSSGRTYTHCVRAFLRKLGEGWLEWQVDKFR